MSISPMLSEYKVVNLAALYTGRKARYIYSDPENIIRCDMTHLQLQPHYTADGLIKERNTNYTNVPKNHSVREREYHDRW